MIIVSTMKSQSTKYLWLTLFYVPYVHIVFYSFRHESAAAINIIVGKVPLLIIPFIPRIPTVQSPYHKHKLMKRDNRTKKLHPFVIGVLFSVVRIRAPRFMIKPPSLYKLMKRDGRTEHLLHFVIDMLFSYMTMHASRFMIKPPSLHFSGVMMLAFVLGITTLLSYRFPL